MKIAVAGTGYVGLSIATLLSQHHEVMAVDIIPEKVDLINHKKSPIQDEYIEKYLIYFIPGMIMLASVRIVSVALSVNNVFVKLVCMVASGAIIYTVLCLIIWRFKKNSIFRELMITTKNKLMR